MKQKIETKLGVIIILIIAITVGAFVWRYEKNQLSVEQPQMNYNFKKPVAAQTPVVNQENNNQTEQQSQDNTTIGTKKYINKTYGFEFEYPKNLVIANNSTENVFGLSASAEGHWIINVTTTENPGNLSLDQAIKKTTELFKNYNVVITNLNVNGVPSKKYSVQSYGDSGNAGVVVVRGSNIITIHGDDSNASLKNIFETVINSFKFNK